MDAFVRNLRNSIKSIKNVSCCLCHRAAGVDEISFEVVRLRRTKQLDCEEISAGTDFYDRISNKNRLISELFIGTSDSVKKTCAK